MNILTIKKKLSICEVTIYIYEVERQSRLRGPERCQRSERTECSERFCTFAQTAEVPRQTFLV